MDVKIPENLQRAMAAEAEAARNARAQVITAEGEFKASRALREASEVVSANPAAMQVRHTGEENTIIVMLLLLAPVSPDPGQHLIREPEHHHLPGAHGHGTAYVRRSDELQYVNCHP